MKLKIKKNDIVKVISGKYAKSETHNTGRVLEVYPEKMQILVEGVNVRIKHMKEGQQASKGGRIQKEIPIHYSNVMILDEQKKPTKIGIKREEKNGKITSIRYAKTTGKDL